MRILFDQGTPRQAAAWFRARDIDAVHTAEIAMAEAADEVILRRAKDEQRVLVCYDKDFPQLLALSRDTAPSVICVRRQGLDLAAFCQLIVATLGEHRAGLEIGGVVSVGMTRSRFHRLPLR